MLDTYNIQIFEAISVADTAVRMKFHLLVDTALVANFTDHPSILKEVNKIFSKENIDKKGKEFLVYIDNFENIGYRNGVRYLLRYDKNVSMCKVQIERQYYKGYGES